MTIRVGFLITAAVLLTVTGCTADGAPTVTDRKSLPVTVIAEAQHCGDDDGPAVTRIDNTDDLIRRYDRLGIPAPVPEIDFDDRQVLLLGMGQQPTPGYGMADPDVRLHDDTLLITIDWQQPLPGLLQAQVITSPCLLISLPAVPFERIEVRDRDGQLRMSDHGSR